MMSQHCTKCELSDAGFCYNVNSQHYAQKCQHCKFKVPGFKIKEETKEEKIELDKINPKED